ncbi:MAG: UDP-N-acetylmuramoyl-L-alanyl-D-glutamate--2,6-diaminopimelate ligase [Clostridia bacterium]|nr:UDP-N-acetylmuramoyl-L-alanyl-D-glutamate--2,6-diaminopimelate ligase [Clostridia bacterium]
MELRKILSGIENLKAKGNIDVEIKNIEKDSKKVKEGSLFIAIKGFDYDGHDYVEEAIKNGAKAIIIEDIKKVKGINFPEDITIVISDNTRHTLAISACNFYGNPSKKLKLIGVTGTKGKTTTTYMIKKLLEAEGKKVGLIGTIENYIGEESLGESDRTTPDSLELQKILYKMVKEKVEFAVMEVSSQALKLNRVDGCDFDVGVFTNFSKEHISEKEHTDLEDYFNSKLKLFDMCKIGFINADDFRTGRIKKSAKCELKTYGVNNQCDLLAKDITITNVSVDYRAKISDKNERIKVNIPGRFSVYNSLAAVSVARYYGVSTEVIKTALETLKVPGRSELIPNKKELNIMIDYAHSPESLECILSAVKTYTRGRVILVFGCGGDRDKEKRPLMGEIAGTLATYTIITSDNPRTEKPEDIIEEIKAGIDKTKGKYEIVVDRIDAIKKAISIAQKRDMIILAGKGHEPYQEIDKVKYPFDERVIVKEIIDNMK